MVEITKVFRFEMAHAIHGYPGKCKDIHGHSYVLHVTVTTKAYNNDYITGPGLIIDFKELKQAVTASVLSKLDHQLVLSEAYLREKPFPASQNLFIWNTEPSVENLLIHIQKTLQGKLPDCIKLVRLKLYETSDSYATWETGKTTY